MPLPQVWARQGGGQPGQALGYMGVLTLHLCVPGKADVPECRPAPSEIFLFFTITLQQFCLLPVGSPTNILVDLTPQCTGLGNVPPAFQLRMVAR